MRLAVAVLFALTGSAGAQTIIDQSANGLPDAEVKEFVRQVTKRLVDPASAQIREISRSADADKQDILCGWMNSKNAMGGYTGFNLVAFGPGSKHRHVYLEEVDRYGSMTGLVIANKTGCPTQDPLTK